MSKYDKASLPTREKALEMAREREAWAKTARDGDLFGSAQEFELTALLLHYYALTLPKIYGDGDNDWNGPK